MKKNAYLGIFGPGPNPSAAICTENRIVAWVEEERFNRIKTAPNSFPVQTIKYCLQKVREENLQIRSIGYAWDCENYAERAMKNLEETIQQYPSDTDQISIEYQKKLNATYNPEVIRMNLAILLKKEGIDLNDLDFTFYSHHLCHAASAFYCSGFEDALVITNDGVGETVTSTLVYMDKKGAVEELESVELPHTLGGMYASVTEFLGFRPYLDEGKTMGLAAYGKPVEKYQDFFDKMARDTKSSFNYKVDPRFRYNGPRTHGKRFSDFMVEELGPPRVHRNPANEDPYPDIAYAAQKKLEEILLSQVSYAAELNRSKNVCFAGGVHMNCKANGLIGETGLFENYFYQPAASDNGVSLGAAFLAMNRSAGNTPELPVLDHLYFGPSFSDGKIEAVLKKNKLKYRRCENIAKDAAELISKNRIVGWFQGPMEVGARALGGRSILANPLDPEARDLLNIKVKNREAWRPFCPSLKEEAFHTYFDTKIKNSPFMIIACRIKEEYAKTLPSCVHIDGTVRPQTVKKNTYPLYWQLLDELEAITGHPIVVNTSFNIQGEPIVMRPAEAVRCFYGSGMDALAIGSFLIEK
jgi:carbamoyltransferase